jgi:N-acetylmuramoyl-L-alanine amidase
MKIRNHLLYHDTGERVNWNETPNKRGHLVGQKPAYIVIHYTGGSTVESAVSTFKNRNSQTSAHLVIGKDGRAVQMARFHERCWHAGRSEWQGIQNLNSYSVGIELVNWGWLLGEPGHWRSWAGTPVVDDGVVRLAHKYDGQQRGWEAYSPEQMEATADIVRALLQYYKLSPEAVVGHDDISPGRKQDPGPAFPMGRFCNSLMSRIDEDNAEGSVQPDVPRYETVFSVTATSGLNLRTGPGIDNSVVKTLSRDAQVIRLEAEGKWWLVSELVKGQADTTGWVYSHWLTPLRQ